MSNVLDIIVEQIAAVIEQLTAPADDYSELAELAE
jgi:hypothetical protein